MSLTTYLKGITQKEKKFCSIIKRIQPSSSEFSTLTNKPAFSKSLNIKVPYKLDYSYQAMRVGTAFDYLARFQVAQVIRNNKEKVYINMVAENFFILFGRNRIEEKLLNNLKVEFEKAIETIKGFIYSDKEIDKTIIYYANYLAKLEQCSRSLMLPKNGAESLLNDVEENIENDLFKLCITFKECFVEKIVSRESIVIFNPKFGKCSFLVGGADADLYVDGTLYDFKVTNKYNYKGKDIQQIMAYYLFQQMNLKFNDYSSSFVPRYKEPLEITKVGIYLARYGEINYIDVSYIDEATKEKCIEDIIKLFTDDDYIKEYIRCKERLELRKKDNKSRLVKEEKEHLQAKLDGLSKRDDEIVIITPNGTTFHTNEQCISLIRSKNKIKVNVCNAIKANKINKCKNCDL